MTYAQPSPEDRNSPEPADTPGLEAGGGVRPGDTPPNAGQMSGTSPAVQRDAPNQGPVSGNRTPMIFALVVIALIVIAVAGLTVASLFGS